jgi:hypothetical protein
MDTFTLPELRPEAERSEAGRRQAHAALRDAVTERRNAVERAARLRREGIATAAFAAAWCAWGLAKLLVILA